MTDHDNWAHFSPCRTWRYSLTRQIRDCPGCSCMIPWLEGAGQHSPGCNVFTEKTLVFVGLNPSTADETVNDPTVRRCMGFARSWGFHRLRMMNLYAYRSTDPAGLWKVDDPVGPANDHELAVAFDHSDLTIVAWGANARDDRLERFSEAFSAWEFHALGLTKAGAPRHPLYMRADSLPVPYELRY